MLMLLKVNKIQFGSGFVRPAIFLFLGLASLIIVSLIGHNQLRKRLFGEAPEPVHDAQQQSVPHNQHYHHQQQQHHDHQSSAEMDKIVREILMNNFNASNIKSRLKQLTKTAHVAGTKNNELLAEYIKNVWLSQGLQSVHFTEYEDVLLSYPDFDNPNRIELFDQSSGRIVHLIKGQSKVIIPSEQDDPQATVTFNAYSANGTVVGQPVYVNYCRKEDYDILNLLNINVSGKIVICRYGHIWRGDKVFEAQIRGAIGVILYSDPKEYAQTGQKSDKVYPRTVWMPGYGVQRGTLLSAEGDPLTPGYPALKYMSRQYTEEDLFDNNIIPKIPVQPIGYNDAWHLLSTMTGPVVSQEWQGGLNFTYRCGPGFKRNGLRLRMIVRVANKKSKIRNVIAQIDGALEPDRYVIVGNHYDAWTYGAVDPNSGTAVMLEMSAALMIAFNQSGWRPRRTIMFCAWDAEEYNVIGSTEWIEQLKTVLNDRALVYLNLDLIGGNETLYVESSPSLIRSTIYSAKNVPNPNPSEVAQGRHTVYDTWFYNDPDNLTFAPEFPKVTPPTRGSDHVQFISYLGIPVINFAYYNKSASNSSYPLYHTLYETMYLVDELMEKNEFRTFIAIGQFWAQLTYIFSNAAVVPMNVTDYAHYILTYIDEMQTKFIRSHLPDSEVSVHIHQLRQSAKRFLMETKKFHEFVTDPKEPKSSVVIEQLNSRLAKLERCFINDRGLPTKPTSRHVIYGSSSYNRYKEPVFPGVYDQFELFKLSISEKDKRSVLKELKMQISIVHYSVECAIQILRKSPR